MEGNLGFALFALLLFGLLVVRPIVGIVKRRRDAVAMRGSADKSEAIFRASFPELQPHFHPRNVADYVTARVGREFGPRSDWERPPGFAAAARAIYEHSRDGERTVLRDAAGATLAEFQFERKPGVLGIVRVGRGKFTVRSKGRDSAAVKYWHPDREFEWSRAGWVFRTPVADEPFESSSSSSSFSSSDSSSGAFRATAAAAGIVGLGGTFDGGGASAGWDDARPDPSSSTAAGDSSGAFVESASTESSGDHAAETSSDSSGDSGSTAY